MAIRAMYEYGGLTMSLEELDGVSDDELKGDAPLAALLLLVLDVVVGVAVE
jgi:hypothetical protein